MDMKLMNYWGKALMEHVYRMVRNKGTDQEEYWALKVIEKNLTKKESDSNIVMT
mgnify:CR=1 FL=1